MGIDKVGSKDGGRKVGGFLQLFDWTAKSRKKLFATKSDSPESSKQGKRYDDNLPMTRLHLVDEDESGTASTFKGSSDHSCASSIADDEGYGGRAPGVVARLMGLNSLPASSFSESYPTSHFETQSILNAQFRRKNVDYLQGHRILYSENLLHKVEGTTRIEELKSQKILNRPIEKFQSEGLPPKSAKTIPVTHHKLLSPIKSSGFITSKNAAYIMEAAAKIIEPGPQVTTNTKMPVLTASPMSLKVRELKEKMDASQKGRAIGSTSLNPRMRAMKAASNKTARSIETRQRRTESNTVDYLKGHSLNKSWNEPDDTTFRIPADLEEGNGFKSNKGKSISLAVQAKVNVQRREGLNSSCNRSLGGQKEQLEGKPITLIKNQPHVRKSMQRKSSGHNSCGVFRQNNQKQNSLMDKDKLPTKSSISKAQSRKVLHGDSPYGRQKNSTKPTTNMKGGYCKQALEITDSEKEVLYSSANHFPRKKRSLGRDFQGRDQYVDSMFEEKAQKPGPSDDTIINNNVNWLKDSKNNGSDVVSFTFTTPLMRTNPASEISGQNVISLDDRVKRVLLESESAKSSPVRYNIIKGDALSILLEQKLRELTNGFQPSHDEPFREGATSSTASNLEDQMPSRPLDNMLSRHNTYQYPSTADLSLTKSPSEFSSVGHQDYRTLTPQTVDRINLQKMNHIEGQFPNCRHPSPISVLEPSFSTESCCSSGSTETDFTAGSKLFSPSIQAQETVCSTFSKKLKSVDTDTELLDSASSISIQSGRDGQVSSQSWELEFVKDILSNVEVMFTDFTFGKTRQIISPLVFNLLNNCKSGFQADGGEYRLRRKLMFDCVCECLDLRLSLHARGGYRMWTKGVATVRRKELLAEQVYKDISGWRDMRDSMVDELVDSDMSTHHGRWHDFDVDAFELGVDIGFQISNSLIDEILTDILRI